MSKVRAGIINATGYIGAELVRLVFQHPRTELKWVTGRSAARRNLGDVFPSLEATGQTIASEPGDDIDLAFSAMPHKSSTDVVPALLERGIRVIDVSADFRLKDASSYPEWYGFTHPAPKLLQEAVYGLPELHRREITPASLVANPGCYSTSVILALAPAVKEGLIEPDIVVDSKSGVSGAGRTLSLTTHYAEANEDVCAYSLGGHRHLPEMTQELELLGHQLSLSITFVPHLIPMTRGILSSCYARLKANLSRKEIDLLYREFYREAPFIRITDTEPHTKQVWGNNFCLIYPHVDARTGKLVVISCIDNLVKGGAGQAVQNMNLMFGLPETSGLASLAIYP
ncbi:MAG: N-acetyl-gamma-glutamyl-phosphate reductase [Dehalococcoidia bacterium]|nr:N-acetyl-gamma-glutamyl-phosphate reductase [Dehalococcoidia bacterium]